MTSRAVALISIAAMFLSTMLVARQLQVAAEPRDALAAPLAITGTPTSARHCVAATSANLHALGWVPANTAITVTFDSDITLATALSRLDFESEQSYGTSGTPDIRMTTSTAGTVVLTVGSTSDAGCYRYKAELDVAAQSAQARKLSVVKALLPKPPKNPIRTMAITGAASSAKHCIAGGNRAAKVHWIGSVQQGSHVRITFDSDFDPIAGITIRNLASQTGRYLINDDSGGDLEPLLSFSPEVSGAMALYVASVDGSVGCYHYKIDITESAPPVALTVFNGAWRGTFAGPANGTLAFTINNGTITVTQPSAGSGSLVLTGAGPQAEGTFFTTGPEGSCTWTGPFIPGGAFHAGGVWTCGAGTPTARSGTWSAAPACSYGVTPTAISIAAAGGTASVTVSAPAGCPWTVTGSTGVTITSGSSGSGNGTVRFTVGANTGPARTLTLTVAGQRVTVSQGGGITPGGGFDATYDFTFTYFIGGAGGGTRTRTLNGFFIVRNGRISASSDPSVTGTVDNAGNARFTGNCPVQMIPEPGSTWTGTMTANPRGGNGTYRCGSPSATNGTWRLSNPR